jgi:hypothetical protein
MGWGGGGQMAISPYLGTAEECCVKGTDTDGEE